MPFDQCCLLCLEKVSPTDNSININSDDSESVNVRNIIEQHFKEEIFTMPTLSNQIVCKKCWELLQSFHEFYIQVTQAHLQAHNKLKALQELEISVTDIKVEPDAEDKLALQELEEITVTDIKVEPDIVDTLASSPVGEEKDSDYSDGENSKSMSSTSVNSESQGDDEEEKRRKTKTKTKRAPKPRNKKRHKTLDHDQFIAQNFKLICCLCEKSLKDFRELKIHYRQEHQTNGYAKCCNKKLYNRGVLVDHIHFHINPEYFKCKFCEKVLCDRSNLESHLQHFHDSKERTIYKCEICGKSFYRRKVLARHYLIHAPEEQRNVKCTQCEKTFCNQYLMKQHLNLSHLNLYAKICDICGKSLNGSEAFQRHQDEHAGVQRTREKCKICNMELKTKYGLARHMKTRHTEPFQTPQICPVCSKVSPTLRAHKSHMEYMHSGKKHVCNVCDKTFKLPKCLREHMATHTGEKLYTCTFCPQTFNSDANMYAHRKRKHPKEWAEKCAKRSTSTGMGQQITNDLESIIESVKDTDETN